MSLPSKRSKTTTGHDGVTAADQTVFKLTAAITAAGGPVYKAASIDPVDDSDGGQPGGNIRVVLLYHTDRGLAFVSRPGGTSTAATTVTTDAAGAPHLTFSPGRIAPTDPGWDNSRKPLAGEFTFGGRTVFVIANHFDSKGGDDPLFGHVQPIREPSRGAAPPAGHDRARLRGRHRRSRSAGGRRPSSATSTTSTAPPPPKF